MKKSVIVAMLAALCAAAWAISPEELLIQAVKNCDIPTLQILLRQRADPNYMDANGKSALVYACEKGWYEGVICLVGGDANIDSRDIHDRTALMYAVQSGYIMIVQFLINNGANINAKDFDRKAALMYAIENKDTQVMNLLLRLGADCSATDIYGDNIAMYAAKNGMICTLNEGALQKKYVIDWNKTNKEGLSPFTVACMKGDFIGIKQLLQEAPIEISASHIDGQPIIIWLIANRKSSAIIEYLVNFCNPEEIRSMTDVEGHDIKYWAEKQGYENILMRLYDYEIEEKGSRRNRAYSKSIRRNF